MPGAGIHVKTIRPPKFLPSVFDEEVKKTFKAYAEVTKKDCQKLTEKWKTKVVWHYRVRIANSPITFEITTKNPIFGYWNYGTKRHPIKPKKAKALHFFWPKVGEEVFLKGVTHPGFKGTHEMKKIEDRVRKELPVLLQQSYDRAAAKCGHSMRVTRSR